MRWRDQKNILVLVLGLWFALAPAFYAMPATAMLLDAGISGDIASDGCDNCPDLDTDSMDCAKLCLMAALFAVSPHCEIFPAVFQDGHLPGWPGTLRELYSCPDPAPPKSAFLQ